MAEDKVIVPIELTVTDIKTGDVKLKDVQKSVEAKLSGIAKSAGDVLGKVDTSKLNKALTSSMEKVQNSYQKLATAKAKFSDAMNSAGSSSPAFKKELQSIQAEMEKTERIWKSFADHLLSNPALQSGLDKRDMGLPLSSSEADALKMFDTAADEYEAKMSMLRDSIPNPNDFISTATATEVQKLITAYIQLFNAVDKVDSANKKWNETVANNKMTDEYTKKLKELEMYEKKLESVRAKAQKMNEVGASNKSWKNVIYDAQVLEQKIRDTVLALQEMIRTGNAFRFDGGDSAEQLAMLEERLANVSNAMNDISNSPGRTVAKVESMHKSINKFCNSVNRGLANVISMFGKLGKSSSKANVDVSKSMKKMLRNILMLVFGVRSTYFLIRRLRKIFIESFKEMASQVPEVNKSISSFMTSLNQLKGSLATGFQPIVSAIIPWLNQLIAALSNAMNALGRFFATLTGQGYIYKFTAAQTDYAASLDKTSGSAKKAQKALMGFDEINRLNDDSGSGGGGGGGGDVPTGTWEKEMLGGMSTLAELIKEAWSDGDFYEVGQYIGEKLLGALQVADEWITTKGYALSEKIGKSLGTLLNGTVDVTGLSDQIGKTLADAYNLALTGIDKFLTTANWINLGQFIADFANSAVRNFDWSLLGKTVADMLKAGIDTWWKFVGEFDFYALGNKVATALNNMFNNILSDDGTGLNVAEKLGTAISNTVRGILETLTTAINNTDWTAVGTTIGEILANIDWSAIWGDLKTLVGAFISGLRDAFYAWKDVDPVSAGITNFLGLAIAGINIASLATGFATALLKVIQFAFTSGLVDDIVKLFSTIGPAIMGALSGVFGGLGELLLNALSGAWNMIKTGLSSISATDVGIVGIITGAITAVTNFVDMLKNGFNWINEILMLLGTAVAAVGAVVAGIVTGPVAALIAGITAAVATIVVLVKDNWAEISAFVKEIPGWFKDNVVTPVSNFFKNAGTTITQAFSTAYSNVKSSWNSAKSWFSGIATGVSTAFDKTVSKIKSGFSGAWSSIKSGCKSAFNAVISSVEKAVNSLIKGVNKVISGVNKIAGGAAKLAGIRFSGISTISTIKLPRLAQGGVIPPNNEFMAILGDQKHGTNIEAPLDTIKQAVAEELSEYIDAMMTGFKAVVDAVNEKDMSVRIGDRDIGRSAERYLTRQAVLRGTR